MNSRISTSGRVLSAVLLTLAVAPAEARFGFHAGPGAGDGPATQSDPAQPAQTETQLQEVEPVVATGRSPIFSQVAIPLGGNTPDQQFLPGTLTVSRDSSNVAYRIRYGNELGFDGYILGGHKPIGASRSTNPTFTVDGDSLAAVVADRGWKLRQGKTFIEGFEPVTAPRFSPDGRRVVYLARMEDQRFVVEGDRPQPMADAVLWDELVFTPDSSVLAYPAHDGNAWRMVINGDPGPVWDSFTTPPIVGPKGARVLYIATKHGRYHVVDRHTPAPSDRADHAAAGFRLIEKRPVFSGNGQAFAYWALGDDLVWRVYQNHVHVPGFDAERPGQLVLNDDGQTLVAILKRGAHWYVVNNGQASVPYAAVGKDSLVLNADASRLAYAVKKSNGWAVVVDGLEQPTYTTIAAKSLRFSPDGERFVYAALSLGRWSVVLDGQAQGLFNKIATRSLTFSPNSQSLAYVGFDAGRSVVTRDGSVLGEYDQASQLTFGPDSQRLVWLAMEGDSSFLVADGMASHETFDELVPGARIHFMNNLKCHTVVVRRPGPTFARVELKLSVPEQTPKPGPDDGYDPDTAPVPPAPAEPASPFVEVPTE